MASREERTSSLHEERVDSIAQSAGRGSVDSMRSVSFKVSPRSHGEVSRAGGLLHGKNVSVGSVSDKCSPALSEKSRILTPILAASRLETFNSQSVKSFPFTSMIQQDRHRATPNYNTTSMNATPTAMEEAGEDDDDIDIHSLGERLTDVLESSLRNAASCSQREKGQNTLGRAAFHIFKGNVGAGVFLLPTYYQDAGYVVGSIIVLLLGLLMIDCSLALVKCKEKINLTTVRTYPAVVGHILGNTLMHFTKFSLIFTQFGFCVVYIQYASSMFAALFSVPNLYELFVFLSVLVVTPMTFFSHRMGLLAYVSMIAAVFVVLVLAGALKEEIVHLSTDGVAGGTQLFVPTMRIFVFISGHMFSLEGIGVVLPVENSIIAGDRPRFPSLVKYTLASIVALYIVFGVTSYLASGDALQTSVVLALPAGTTKTLLQILLGLSLTFSYPIQYVPAIQLVDRALNISVKKTRETAYFVRIVLNVFFGTLAASIGAETLNVFASFLGAFTGVHLMITLPVLLALFTDHVLSNDVHSEQREELSFLSYVKLFFTMPDTIAGCRWHLYFVFALCIWIGGTYYAFDSVFA